MEIKCPFCKGVANKMWFSHLDTNKPPHVFAVFVVECWSGDLGKVSKYHFFQTRIKLLKETEIDQIKELEAKIERMQKEAE